MTLRISTPAQEGIYQGSKYLKYQVLCDGEELKKLFDGSFGIYPLTFLGDANAVDVGEFLEEYSRWIDGLKRGLVPEEAQLKKWLGCALTADTDALWRQEIPGGRYLVKMAKPVIQMQAHFFTYSRVDGVFRPMSMGLGSIFWGLQFSYPQLFQDPKTMELLEVDGFVNCDLFQKIKLWVRNETRATPFVVDGKRVNVPMRIGKNCLSWVANHPQLQLQQIGVYAS